MGGEEEVVGRMGQKRFGPKKNKKRERREKKKGEAAGGLVCLGRPGKVRLLLFFTLSIFEHIFVFKFDSNGFRKN